jgi:hypothetical protein
VIASKSLRSGKKTKLFKMKSVRLNFIRIQVSHIIKSPNKLFYKKSKAKIRHFCKKSKAKTRYFCKNSKPKTSAFSQKSKAKSTKTGRWSL